jgi:hypothetical protein
MADSKGFLKLPRTFQEDPIWTERRTFSKAEAWLDILFQARYGKVPKETMLGLKTYTCRRGECLKSMHTWAERWDWSIGKVRRFFHMLQKRNMIVFKADTQTTHLKIVIYEDYTGQQYTNENQTARKRKSNENQTKTEEEGSKKDERMGKKTPLPPLKIPEGLTEVWGNWETYLAEKRKKLTPSTRSKQLAKLAKYDAKTATAMIEQSIEHGWIGLFEIKENYSNGKSRTNRKGIGPSATADQQYYIPELGDSQVGSAPAPLDG